MRRERNIGIQILTSKDRHFGNESQELELAEEQKGCVRRSKWSNYMGSDGRRSC